MTFYWQTKKGKGDFLKITGDYPKGGNGAIWGRVSFFYLEWKQPKKSSTWAVFFRLSHFSF